MRLRTRPPLLTYLLQPVAHTYILRDVLVDPRTQVSKTDWCGRNTKIHGPDPPMLVLLGTTNSKSSQAAGQTPFLDEWVVVQVGSGRLEPQALPPSRTLPVATGVLHDQHMALHALDY